MGNLFSKNSLKLKVPHSDMNQASKEFPRADRVTDKKDKKVEISIFAINAKRSKGSKWSFSSALKNFFQRKKPESQAVRRPVIGVHSSLERYSDRKTTTLKKSDFTTAAPSSTQASETHKESARASSSDGRSESELESSLVNRHDEPLSQEVLDDLNNCLRNHTDAQLLTDPLRIDAVNKTGAKHLKPQLLFDKIRAAVRQDVLKDGLAYLAKNIDTAKLQRLSVPVGETRSPEVAREIADLASGAMKAAFGLTDDPEADAQRVFQSMPTSMKETLKDVRRILEQQNRFVNEPAKMKACIEKMAVTIFHLNAFQPPVKDFFTSHFPTDGEKWPAIDVSNLVGDYIKAALQGALASDEKGAKEVRGIKPNAFVTDAEKAFGKALTKLMVEYARPVDPKSSASPATRISSNPSGSEDSAEDGAKFSEDEREQIVAEDDSSQGTKSVSVKNNSNGHTAATITQAESGDESEEPEQSSKPVTEPNSTRSQLNSSSFRIVDIGEGSPLEPKVARAMEQANHAFDEKSIDKIALNPRSERFYRSFLRELQEQDPNVNFTQGLKVIASGQMDKFVQRLGSIVAEGSNFRPDVHWQFEYDSKRKCVLATYGLERAIVGKANASSYVDPNERVGLSGEIVLFPNDSKEDWVLENPRLYLPKRLQSAEQLDDDSGSDSLVSSSSFSEVESSEDVEDPKEGTDSWPEDGLDQSQAVASTSARKVLTPDIEPSWKSVKPKLPTTDLATEQASARPKAIKKNQHAANLRKVAWIAKENTGKSVKTAAKNIKENLKTDVQIEAEQLYGKSSAEGLNKARRRKALRKENYREVVGACIPEMTNKPILEPVLYFQSICGPLSTKGAVRKLEEGLRKQHRMHLLGKEYARGALDCHKALLEGEHSFARTKVNWLPEEMQEAYVAAGSPQKITAWLQELIEIRNQWLSNEAAGENGTLLSADIAQYEERLKKARVTQELIANKNIVFRHALSYATGWETAFNQADARKLVVAR